MRISTKHLLTSLSALLIAAPTHADPLTQPAAAKHGTLSFQTTGNVTRVTINNGPINIIDPNLITDLLTYLVSIQPSTTTTTPKVVIFDSSNPDWFLGPLDTVLTHNPITQDKITATINYSYLAPLLQNITTTAFIAEINGRNIGGGHELALQMDMRFAGPNAHTGFFEDGLGLTVGGGGQLFLGQLINKGRALEYLLSAKAFDGPTGAALGLFNEYYPTGAALTSAVNTLAQRIGLFPQDALNDTKSALDNYLNPSPALLATDVTNFLALNDNPVSQALQTKFLALSDNETDGAFEKNLPEDITELYQ
ncbi:hypothetical protein HO173_009353 [Letharia columbiana]|uniref:Enoyl-CoA hydratase n=1 Tax=Letharia columbiana TaxID=112416 RepID=A0A8H6FPX6_9LECA|nr:uncharacterized protein HO173_009353 [Letharia columbiana]KAF6232473.1 hypothetical protein HO173_009353 [Letharia columbiana]